MKAMILAAGRGERMRPLTDTVPKPLLKVGGRSLIEWHLLRLGAAGFRQVVINHAHLGAAIEAALGDGSRWNLQIRYSAEGQALETAGGIATALPLLGDQPFLVVNGDVYCEYPFERAFSIAQQLSPQQLQAWCVLVDNPAHHAKGDFGLANGLLRPGPYAPEHAAAQAYTFSGVAVYLPAFFAQSAAGVKAALAPLLRTGAAQGRIGAERFQGRWVDVGTPQRLTELDQLLNSSGTGQAPAAEPAAASANASP